jgi:GntR family transcriptional regulator/MocR family aminotransferase
MAPLSPALGEGAALHRQIYAEVREAVLAGRLAAGARLPSTRTLAEELGVSRNTVLTAFDQLLAEGYLEGKVGSGTYVARIGRGVAAMKKPARSVLSRRGEMIAGLRVTPARPHTAPRPFRPGQPDAGAFPVKIWARLAARQWRCGVRERLAYGESAGYRPLREAIAWYVGAARAARCDPEQVVIVSGAQQGLDLAARLLLDPGDAVWMEDPGYLGARGAFLAAGAKALATPVDLEGLDPAQAQAGGAVRLAYVTPSHQFPTGVTMSLRRRLALLEWARRASAWILEDDYYSEYRYAGRPIPCMQGLDKANRVVYVGSFSKTLFPSLRLRR